MLKVNQACYRLITIHRGFQKKISNKFQCYPSLRIQRSCSTSVSTGSSSAQAQTQESKHNSTGTSMTKVAFEDYDDYVHESQEPLNPVHVVFALTVFGLGIACLGYAISDLLPTRMSTTNVFSNAFETVRRNDDIIYYVGENMKAYGRDSGGNEGRRNHIDSYTYKESDGSNRNRVRFNIEGSRGQMLVYAEVSDKYTRDFVYLICQHKKTGRVITVIDNRDSQDLKNAEPSNYQKAVASILGRFQSKST